MASILQTTLRGDYHSQGDGDEERFDAAPWPPYFRLLYDEVTQSQGDGVEERLDVA